MNQILVTGNEWEEKVPKSKKTKAPKKEKKLLEIRPVIVFYAITLIMLGICIISGSVYAKSKINEVVLAEKKPELDIIQNNDTSTIDIQISHIRGINKIEYKWNDENEKTIEANGQNEIKETIPQKGGENKLTIIVTEENGQTVTYEKTYTSDIPIVQISSVSNGVKIASSSENSIDKIEYKWDDEESETIEVNAEKYEKIINAPEGKHKLEIEVTDSKGKTSRLEQVVVGVKAPTVQIKAALRDGKKVFVVDVEDDTEISKVEITLNGNTVDEKEVGDKTYHKEIEIQQGDNRIVVKATNINEQEMQKAAKFKN